MSKVRRHHGEYLENIAFNKTKLYNENTEATKQQEDVNVCKDVLIAYMGLDEFKKLSKDNLNMIIGAMQEHAQNKK
mgnify:CR=1 FL=1|tara:strand:+ start:23563 stop:23790 length:228 start_codon:yes stop_codon:yes gene_type:complete